MCVEHHLLCLTWVSANEEHPAVAKPDMGNLHRYSDAIDQHDLMAPVELVGFTRCKGQRHEGGRRSRSLCPFPRRGILPDGVIAAIISEPTKVLIKLHQR